MRKPHTLRRLSLALAVLAGCGGGGTPTGPPPPTAEPGHTVVAVVYYDENGNGTLDGTDEIIRIPDVEVTVGGRSARSERRTGRAQVAGVPAGTQSVSVRPDTMPPFFAAGPAATVSVPTADDATVALPLTLSIGGNQPNVYMAFGDSITAGDGLPATQAYPARLEARLTEHFGWASVRNRGATGTNSFEALERLQRNYAGHEPAYILVMYGVNDWHDDVCKENPDCHTVDNLRIVVQRVKGFRSLPFVATLPPVNPALNPAERNEWIRLVNVRIRAMAREEGAFVADLERAFDRQGGDMTRFFLDHVHLNAAGHDVMAAAFFEAIAHGRSE
jgi:lysophospholipase L1-like esterase